MLLKRLGIPFEVLIADVDEDVVVEPDPAENVRLRARLKGEALQALGLTNCYVLTSDTSVSVDGELLNKPNSVEEAQEMLRRLCGRTHQVYTAVVLTDVASGRIDQWVEVTDVLMRPYTDVEVDTYIATGDPFDKAGAYAIQHPTFQPVAKLDGCYTSVVGLPVCQVARMLMGMGIEIADSIYTKLWEYDTMLCSCLPSES